MFAAIVVLTHSSGHGITRLRTGSLFCDHFLIDLANLFAPANPFPVRHLKNVTFGPVEVIGDEGYLLIEPFEGVASDSP